MSFVVLEHKQLKVWQKSMELANKVYLLTRDFPSEEKFGLTQQIRRAAVSVPSNIAEGCSRDTVRQTVKFLFISLGSLSEVDTQLLLAKSFGYMQDDAELNALINEVKALLIGTIKMLKKTPQTETNKQKTD